MKVKERRAYVPRREAYTKQEDETLRTMFEAGDSYPDIADAIGRTIGSVQNRARRLGMAPPKNSKAQNDRRRKTMQRLGQSQRQEYRPLPEEIAAECARFDERAIATRDMRLRSQQAAQSDSGAVLDWLYDANDIRPLRSVV
jgi:hypothetical protein